MFFKDVIANLSDAMEISLVMKCDKLGVVSCTSFTYQPLFFLVRCPYSLSNRVYKGPRIRLGSR